MIPTVLVIDPGLANTGVLLYDGNARRVVFTDTVRTHATDGTMTEALARCAHVSGIIGALAVNQAVGVVVIESYRDIPGHLRGVRNRWMTPLLLGWLARSLSGLGFDIVWQDPERVMRTHADHMAAWKRKQYGIIGGDELLTNEHLRSAGAHLLAYLSGPRICKGAAT